MSTVFSKVYFPASRRRHTLCLPNDDIFRARNYEYECPSAKRTVRMPLTGQL